MKKLEQARDGSLGVVHCSPCSCREQRRLWPEPLDPAEDLSEERSRRRPRPAGTRLSDRGARADVQQLFACAAHSRPPAAGPACIGDAAVDIAVSSLSGSSPDVTTRPPEFDGFEFASGRAELPEGGDPRLQEIGAYASVNPDCRVVIEAHTDSVGGNEINL